MKSFSKQKTGVPEYLGAFVGAFLVGLGCTVLLELYIYAPWGYRIWIFPVFLGVVSTHQYWKREKEKEQKRNEFVPSLLAQGIMRAAEGRDKMTAEEERWLDNLDSRWEEGGFPVAEPKRRRKNKEK
jgi:hypothetical protein